MMICSWCGSEDDTVGEVHDPFLRDVYDEYVDILICDDCYSKRKDEI